MRINMWSHHWLICLFILDWKKKKREYRYVNNIPLGVHIEDDGLVVGGLNEGPEGVLVDLGNLSHFDCGSHSVQARPHSRHHSSAAALTHGALWVWQSVGGNHDRVLRGVVEKRLLRRPNGWSWEREVQSHFESLRERVVENCAQRVFSGVCYPPFFFFFFFFLAKKISEGMDTMMDSILCYRWIVKFDGFFFFHLKK